MMMHKTQLTISPPGLLFWKETARCLLFSPPACYCCYSWTHCSLLPIELIYQFFFLSPGVWIYCCLAASGSKHMQRADIVRITADSSDLWTGRHLPQASAWCSTQWYVWGQRSDLTPWTHSTDSVCILLMWWIPHYSNYVFIVYACEHVCA